MYGLGILKGMAVTIRNMLRGPITVQYPDERLTLPERARWAVAHKYDAEGRPKCTACLICVKECPDHILSIETSPNEAGGKHIDRYRYEIGACMMCGLCVEACPFDAIEMSKEYELASADKTTLVRILLSDVDAASPRKAKADAPEAAAPAEVPAPDPKEGTDA